MATAGFMEISAVGLESVAQTYGLILVAGFENLGRRRGGGGAKVLAAMTND